VQDIGSNIILLFKHEKNKTWLCCNVVPKIGIEQMKCNMKENYLFMYIVRNLVQGRFLTMIQNISKYVFGQVFNYIMNGLWMKIWKVDIHGWPSSMLMFGDFFGSNVNNDVGDDVGDVIHDI
jgi:hypothetical protein